MLSRRPMAEKKAARLSLHPLAPEEALADLLKVKPPAKTKANRKKTARKRKSRSKTQ